MRGAGVLLGLIAGVLLLTLPGDAAAQQRTFHLDRLETPGGPEDGAVLFRPVTQPKPIFFGQLGLGYSHEPLHTRNVTSDPGTLRRSTASVIRSQLTQYMTAGFQFMDRYTLAATLPVTWLQTGGNPNYASSLSAGPSTTAVTTSGPAVSDTRLDIRAVIARSEDRRSAFGAQLSIFVPTGTLTNFGGDGQATTMLMINGEWTWRFLTFVGNLGVHFRPTNSINNPSAGQGLGIGNEARWAAGVLIPLKNGKFRIGGTLFGQTGIESNAIAGDTFFRLANTPIEWNVEGRMKFGARDAWWVGAGGGTLVVPGYGAPTFRVVGLLGASIPIVDSDARSPQREMRARWQKERSRDTDNDGIPDDIDACPTEAEDKRGSDPNDGCPMPPDRDGDGVPDQWDQCPDKPEDRDGIEDGDGCPEEDFDQDGVADTEDACPRAPGKRSTDPKANGCPTTYAFEDGVIKIKQQVHFKTGSAEILPDSFPMLQEIADLLKANQGIKRVAIEGHTDNKGSAVLNKNLSQARSESVMRWLVQHGTEAARLEAHGYGMEKPIDSNATEAGRANNRRVEFHIVDEADMNKPRGPEKNDGPKQQAPKEPSSIELD